MSDSIVVEVLETLNLIVEALDRVMVKLEKSTQ